MCYTQHIWMWLGVIILQRNLKYILKEVQCKYLCNTKVPSNTKDKIFMNFLFLQMRQSGEDRQGDLPKPHRGISDRVSFELTSPDNMARPLLVFHVSEREHLKQIICRKWLLQGPRWLVKRQRTEVDFVSPTRLIQPFYRWQFRWFSWNWQIIILGNSKVKKQHRFVNL